MSCKPPISKSLAKASACDSFLARGRAHVRLKSSNFRASPRGSADHLRTAARANGAGARAGHHAEGRSEADGDKGCLAGSEIHQALCRCDRFRSLLAAAIAVPASQLDPTRRTRNTPAPSDGPEQRLAGEQPESDGRAHSMCGRSAEPLLSEFGPVSFRATPNRTPATA